MLKNKESLLVSEKECALIDRINSDNASGRHLLSERSEEYWSMRRALEEARVHCNDGTATDKEKQMVEYQKQASDYFYWKHLPEEKKLFIDTDDATVY